MISRIILRKQGYSQLLVAILGSLLGMFVLLAAIQFYFDLRKVMVDRKDILGADFVVVQKKITELNTFTMKHKGFSPEEIEDFRQQKFSNDVGPIESGLFRVSGSLAGSPDLPKMYTELFFESVDDRFIDVQSEEWKWYEGSDEVPIILPGSYLEAYNFGMAPSQSLPTLTEKTISNFYFDITISGNGRSEKFKGNVAGFSDRINTILVPKGFLDWANSRFQTMEKREPSRLVIELDDITDPTLAKYLEENNYETNEEKLKGSRIKTILNICLMLFLILGGTIVVLSVLGFIQYSQLIISRLSYELRVLIAQGYHYGYLARKYMVYFGTIFILMSVTAVAMLYLAKAWFTQYLREYYFEPDPGLYTITWLSLVGFLGFFMIANSLNIYRMLRSLAKSL